MELGGKWPVSIVATPEVAAGARLWRTAGGYRLTIVVKATFSPQHQQTMTVVAPDPIVVDDSHVENDEARSVLAASDLSPYLPRGEVMFVGRAHSAQGAVPAVSVRLAVYGARPLVEKTLHVVGPRTLGESGAGAPEPFTDLPISYEHALRGAMEENPAGIVPAPGLPMPTILDPDDAGSPAGFGPLSTRWAGRRRLLRGLDPALLDAAVPDLPDAFAWSFFHAAPADQRCSFFAGDEWVVLDNLWRGAARIESRLPNVRGGARLYDGGHHLDVPLLADTLFIDGNREVCSLVWRGNVPVNDPARLSAMEVLAGLELPGRPIPWPAEAPSSAAARSGAAAAGGAAAPEVAARPASTPPQDAHTSGSHQAVAAQPSAPAYTPHPSGAYQAVAQAASPAAPDGAGPEAGTPAPYVPNPSGQHQAVGAYPADPHAPQPHHISGQHQAVGPQAPQPQHPSGQHQAVGPRAPLPPSPSGLYQAVGQEPRRTSTPSGGYRLRMPTPPPGSGPGHAPSPTPPHGTPRTPTPPHGLPRTPTPPQGLPRMPTPAPVGRTPPPPPPEDDDDGGHTVMRPVDARLLAELASMDGPTTVGRHQEREPPRPPAPSEQERSESTALFNMSADTTLMRIARGEAQSPVSQAQTSRIPTSEHELVDEQTFVHDDAELQKLLDDSAATSSRSGAPTTDRVGPPTGDARPAPSSVPPETLATPMMLAPDPMRRALRATSRGLGPVHVLEASAVENTASPVPDGGAEPPSDEGKTQHPPSLEATHPGNANMRQALRDEMMRRLIAGESLEDAQLEGADLSDIDLSQQNFARANLRGARFDRSKLDGADLTGARLDGAFLAGVSLTGAKLGGASLENANLDGASLLSAVLDEANLASASMAGAIVVDATGSHAIFRDAELRDARFDRSRLRSADFERARLTNASFLGCDLQEASFFEAAGVSASFVEATLTGARFDLSHFAMARFARAVATDTLWNEAVLDGASFEAASLTGATFGKASCQGVIFSSADLSEARFPRAKLDGASFTGADLQGAMFDSPDGPPTGPTSGIGGGGG